jgi:hypothetical protein
VSNDTAILLLLADKQREVEALKAEVAALREEGVDDAAH